MIVVLPKHYRGDDVVFAVQWIPCGCYDGQSNYSTHIADYVIDDDH